MIRRDWQAAGGADTTVTAGVAAAVVAHGICSEQASLAVARAVKEAGGTMEQIVHAAGAATRAAGGTNAEVSQLSLLQRRLQGPQKLQQQLKLPSRFLGEPFSIRVLL